jgi:putative DNA primase/helicase
MEPINKVLLALRELDCKPRGGGNQWSALCPAHSDRRPSLAIGLGEDARVLLRCHAGCSCTEILDALGLRYWDLHASHLDNQHGKWSRNSQGTASKARPRFRPTKRPTRQFNDEQAAVEALSQRLGIPSNTWRYRNAGGDHIGSVIRWDTTGGKEIRPLSRVAGGWAIAAMSAPRPIYCLPYISDMPPGSTVHVHEGEVAADAGWLAGLVSTTSPGGANGAHLADWSALREKEVVIWPDHDESGRRYAKIVSELAVDAGAESVRVMDIRELLPDAPSGADFADLVEQASWTGVPQ